MRRFIQLGLVFGLLLPLVAFGDTTATTDSARSETSMTAESYEDKDYSNGDAASWYTDALELPRAVPAFQANLQPTLLETYYLMRDVKGNLERNYRGIEYKPGGGSLPGFKGWDVLYLPETDYQGEDWLHLAFNRDARVALLWTDSAEWLSDWDHSYMMVNDLSLQIFTRDVPAGELVLPAPGPDQEPYSLLIAEADGEASQLPPLPKGVAATERPVANERCPDWLHNAYLAEGPEGGLYHSWHPQIDPVYWCYFGHEHGSDPSLVTYAPAFNYVADKNYRQNEQHEGFKGFAYRDEAAGLGWYLNIHMTTSNINRVCVRFHTVVIAVTDLATGELLAELGYKGDFGALRTTREVRSNGTSEPKNLQPTLDDSCPDQAQIRAETDAVKLIRVANVPPNTILAPGGYEKWEGGIQPKLGVTSARAGMEVDIRNPMTDCDTLACKGAVRNAVAAGFDATARALSLRELTVSYNASVADLDAADGAKDGVFWTDPYGAVLAEPGGETALRQYIKPGLNVTAKGFLVSEDAWRVPYTNHDGRVIALGLEYGIGDEN